jgi:acetamidase/formamidase
VGYDKDLNAAFRLLQEETVKLIVEQGGVTPAEARTLMLATWDCRVSEIVNVLKGTYCMVPKGKGGTKAALPTHDDARAIVTHARNADLNKAMDAAALAMVDRLAAEKGLSRLDAYSLASMTMDCRLGSPADAEHEVHCMVRKSLWTDAP